MRQKKVKKRYILLIVLVVLLVVLAALAFWQRENIRAVLDYTSYSKEEIEDQLQKNDQAIKDTVNAIEDVTIRDVTEEEKAALKDGSLSQEELVDRLLGNEAATPVEPEVSQTPQPPEQTEQPQATTAPQATPETTPTPTPTPEQSDYQKKLSELVARVYVLREEYLISLDNLLEEAKEVYKSTPKEKRTGSWLADTVSSYLAKGTALEKECDRKMDAIVKEMEELIKANNGDMSLVDTVIETYANEKRLKKAWYMSKLEERGLI